MPNHSGTTFATDDFELEREKANTLAMIHESQIKVKSTFWDRAMIIAYLEKDIDALKNKNPDDLKRSGVTRFFPGISLTSFPGGMRVYLSDRE